ncbi:PRTRC system protein C [Acidithiobacillus ferridurans]|uniref:PRTRC system protein C n=1 Tax=Acidithiobacillus ferridurans TaxID=1232575 RepID=A0A8X8G8S7_ACIFI|nr:PRTRC system protein C [Acidithiobacillus ferridurans]MBU2715585.1 PRTRC system protein C [Acidithiobacillus ferridurans]MBU2722925.1 PRTRC system protein C [Acidithiobacillus ferridurans]MBU2728183.1 PRTRC system protein C [Acidithiobacillus ferridurans]
MAIAIEELKRVFKYNGRTLPDPSPAMSVDSVQTLYSNQYHELASAGVTIEIIGNRQVVTFEKTLGKMG